MKKGTCILLVYAILMTLLVVAPFNANANEKDIAATGEIIDSGTTGDCTWTLDDEGLLTISGNGDMSSNVWFGEYPLAIGPVMVYPWHEYKVKKAVIEDGVTNISNGAFFCCEDLLSITFPDSVKSIGKAAFYNCKSMNNINICDSIETIGDYSFSGCESLLSAIIPDSTNSIGKYCFESCSNLSNVYVGNAVISLDKTMFKGCSNIIKLHIGDSVESIDSKAFSGYSKITNVFIGNSVKTIGENAFNGCIMLNGITIGNSVENIAAKAFYGCTSLTSVTIPATVTDIFDKAFGYYNKEGFGETKVKNFTIYGYTGSEAQRYADDNRFTFVALDSPTEEPTVSPAYREYFGDIDGDDEVTAVDVTWMQRYLAEYQTPYPIGEQIK